MPLTFLTERSPLLLLQPTPPSHPCTSSVYLDCHLGVFVVALISLKPRFAFIFLPLLEGTMLSLE